MTIRSYRCEDREAVVSLWQAAGLIRPLNDPYRDIDRKIDHDPEGLLLAVDGEIVIGVVMAGYDGHRGWINYLGVHPDRQKEGVGRVLVDAAVEYLRQQGCPKVNLQVRRSNAAVVGFYESLGFIEDDLFSMGLRLVDDGVVVA